MNQELINQIRKITEKVLQEQLIPAESEKRLLVIFDATQVELDVPLQQLQKCVRAGWKIRIILTQLATITIPLQQLLNTFGEKNVLQEHDLTRIPEIVETYPRVVLPTFSYPMAAKLAMRIVDTPCLYLIFEALCKEKQVIAASDGLNRDELRLGLQAVPFFEKLEREYVNILSELGVQWVPATQIADTICQTSSSRQSNVDAAVISASVIANLDDNVREVFYTHTSIITPLAQEHARKKGIRLVPRRTNIP